jgi:hypothetical protein
MAEVREVAFELERFGWSPPDQLEVVGRWSGLEGRRLGRPVLTLDLGAEKVRLTALPGGHFSRSGTWRALFTYDGEPEAVTGAVLEIGRRLLVDLPPPRRRRVAKDAAALEHERSLRMELEQTLAERDAEITGLRDEAETAIGERDNQIEALRAEIAEIREQLTAAEAEREQLRTDLAIRDEELVAAREETRTARAEADAAREAAAAARGEIDATREQTEQRLAAERAAATEIREKLATAREAAESTIETEAQETERLRAELRAAREENERLVSAERAETARLREELAARSANGGDDADAEAAARRMYERVARELENERAAARHLRRELDAVQAQTAEHRRVVSSAAANGLDPADATPGAATPAGRLAAARRTERGRAAAQHRADAARAAAAHRIPEHRSPVAVWVVRGIAVAIVAALFVALLLIVSAVT